MTVELGSSVPKPSEQLPLHVAEPFVAAYVPGTHALHAVAPASDAVEVPAGQLKHAVEPVALLKEPTVQMEHAADPAAAEKLPAAHATHALADVAPANAEAVPAGQTRHAVRPVAFEKLPAGHVVHMPHAALTVPGGHKGPGSSLAATKFWKLFDVETVAMA